MSAKITHDVVDTIGEYKDRDGQTKKRYTNVGSQSSSTQSLSDHRGQVGLASTRLTGKRRNRNRASMRGLRQTRTNLPMIATKSRFELFSDRVKIKFDDPQILRYSKAT
jgi:hypothetical protein